MANGLQQFNPLGQFVAGKQAGLASQQQQFNLQQSQRAAPIQNALADIGLERARQGQRTDTRQAGISEQSQRIQFLNRAGKALLDAPFEQRQQAIARLEPLAQSFGIEAGTFTPERLSDESLQQLVATTEGFIGDPSTLTAAQRQFESLSKAGGFTPEQRQQAARVAAGIEARPTSAAPQVVDIGGVPHIFNKRTNKLVPAEVEGAPVTTDTIAKSSGRIKAAQRLAIDTAKNLAEEAQTDRSGARALNVYNTGMTSLVEALGGTVTGPFAGLSPALAASQQIADGAVAAMAPVLKQMFRAAGEGVFTDRDQALLLEMVPKRRDRPATIVAKAKNIDAIVRAKLEPLGKLETTGQRQGGQIMIDAQGNRARVFPDGTFEEL